MHSRTLWRSISIALVFLVIAIGANYYAAEYAALRASSPVTDIVLSNIPVYNVEAAFVIGPIIFWMIMGLFMLTRVPQKIPFALKSLGLLLLVRAFFITLTHIGPYPVRTDVEFDMFGLFSSGSDLFFSGHTALPFLMALVFWQDRRIRIFCIASSIFFGGVVLLGHLHYSIDVAAAFFITFTIHHLSTLFFKRDYVHAQTPVVARSGIVFNQQLSNQSL